MSVITLSHSSQTIQKDGLHQLYRWSGVSEGADGGLEHHGGVRRLQEVHQRHHLLQQTQLNGGKLAIPHEAQNPVPLHVSFQITGFSPLGKDYQGSLGGRADIEVGVSVTWCRRLYCLDLENDSQMLTRSKHYLRNICRLFPEQNVPARTSTCPFLLFYTSSNDEGFVFPSWSKKVSTMWAFLTDWPLSWSFLFSRSSLFVMENVFHVQDED